LGKRTPLYDEHLILRAKMIEFAGWEMPVSYTSIKEEHQAVRKKAGLFDIGHMGAIKVSGRSAATFLQKVLSNDITKLKPGASHYSIILNRNGGTVDDIFVYNLGDFFILIVNASNTEKDVNWLKSNMIDGVEIRDLKDGMTLLAFQGPRSQEVLQSLLSSDLRSIGHHEVMSGRIKNMECLVSRTGYTGEDGFELFIEKKNAEFLWGLILEAGRNGGVLPCGLGARDTLRLEASLPLYGHEYSEEISPIEAGFSFAVKLDKSDFIGRGPLLEQKKNGVKRKLVGIRTKDENSIPRQGYPIFADEKPVGAITSGTHSPTLGYPIAMGFVNAGNANIGQPLDVEIRGKRCPAEIVSMPFYKRA